MLNIKMLSLMALHYKKPFRCTLSFGIGILQSGTHFRSRNLMQCCSQAIRICKDQFYKNCIKGNILSITQYFDVLSYLCE